MAETGLLSPPYRRLSIAIYTTIALVAFEGTSIAAALPDLAAELGDVERLPWVITAYLFAVALTTVIAGPLVDAIGSQAVFDWSVALFAVAGFAAGLVGDLPTMIVVRLIQGGASGFVLGAATAAVNLGFPSRLTGRAFAANSTIWGVVGAAGPAIAAALLAVASWHWIFFVNLPLGVGALVAGRGRLPGRQPGAERLRLDWLGALLVAVFTLASILAVDQIGWGSLAFAALAIVALVAYRAHARRVDRPVVSLSHLTAQPYLGLAVVPMMMIGAALATNIYVTLYATAGRGLGSGLAAWTVLTFTLGWTAGANWSTWLLDRRSVVEVMWLGQILGVIGFAIVAPAVFANTPILIPLLGLFVVGVGIGLATNGSMILLREVTPDAVIGRAAAANQFVRNQGFTLGSAAGGAILLFVVGRRTSSVDEVRSLLAGDADGAGPAVADAVRVGFGTVAVVSLVVMALAAWPMWRLAHAERIDPARRLTLDERSAFGGDESVSPDPPRDPADAGPGTRRPGRSDP